VNGSSVDDSNSHPATIDEQETKGNNKIMAKQPSVNYIF
jgi:hypothetical protein